MRVAFVVSNLSYPPVEGLHQQSILTARSLAASGYTVELFGFVKDATALDEVALARDTGLRFATPPIRTGLPDVVLGIANQLLPLAWRGRRIKAVGEALRDYGAVHLENVGAIGLVRPQIERRSILGLVDPGTLRWRRFAASAPGARARWSARFKLALHAWLEARVLRPGTSAHLVSAADAAYLRQRHPGVRVAAIPVALPDEFVLEPPALPRADSPPKLLVFIDLRHAHLRQSFLWFAREVLTRSAAARAAALIVLGRVEPDRELTEAVAGQDTTFVAWVDNYRGMLAEASIVVTPDLVGTGLKNRVLQSMATGRPVVGTSAAFEAIAAVPGCEAVIADDPAEMAAEIDALLADPSRRAAMGAAGRARVIGDFSADAVRRSWRALYDAVAENDSVPVWPSA